MSVRIINSDQVTQLLTMQKCVDLVEDAHKHHSLGNAVLPLRTSMDDAKMDGIIATMPAYLKIDNRKILGMKLVTVFHENEHKGLESHQASIILCDPDTGITSAIVDGRIITAMRTAAASAVATKYLSKNEASSMAILGTGVQAYTHLDAINCVRSIDEVNVWNRTTTKAEKFVKECSSKYPDLKFSIYESVRDATKDSDIINTLTASPSPILSTDDVNHGVHINAVGSSTPGMRELSTDLVTKSTIFTDAEESLKAEAGEYVIPLSEGKLTNHSITEIGDVITSKKAGRSSQDEITLYKSLGVGIQDIVTADHVLSLAIEKDIGATTYL